MARGLPQRMAGKQQEILDIDCTHPSFGRVKGPTYTAAHVSMLLILPVKVLTCKILRSLRKAWVDIGLSSTDICR